MSNLYPIVLYECVCGFFLSFFLIWFQKTNKGLVMIAFYTGMINCPPNNKTTATLSQVAGKSINTFRVKRNVYI